MSIEFNFQIGHYWPSPAPHPITDKGYISIATGEKKDSNEIIGRASLVATKTLGLYDHVSYTFLVPKELRW